MYDPADKNSKFLEAINRVALKNCQALDNEIKEQTRVELEQAEAKIHAECHQKMEKEIQKRKSATVRQLAQYGSEKREVTGRRRQEIEDAVFQAVLKNLSAYRKTDAYLESMMDSARAMKSLFDGIDDLIVFIGEADLPLAPQLQKVLGRCEIKTDPFNKMGGIRAESRTAGLVADDTFAARLEKQKQWFAENSGLKIV